MTDMDKRIWNNVARREDSNLKICNAKEMESYIRYHVNCEWFERLQTQIGIGLAIDSPYSQVNLEYGNMVQMEKIDMEVKGKKNPMVFKLFIYGHNIRYVCILAKDEVKHILKRLSIKPSYAAV